MKRFLLLLLFCSGLIEMTGPAAPLSEIVIDGDFSDWESVASVVYDASGDTRKPGTDILEFRVAHDAKNLYVSSVHAGPMVSEDAGTGGQGRYYYLVFVDLDASLDTGFNPAVVDPPCYAPSSVGCDFEVIFERDWDDGSNFYRVQNAFANGAPSFFILERGIILQGRLRIGFSSDYQQQVEYKFQHSTLPQGIVLTQDLNKDPAPGVGVFLDHAFSADMTRLEMAIDFRAALRDNSLNPNLALEKYISVGFACESSPFSPSCGDGIEPLYDYVLEGPPTPTPTSTVTLTPTLTVTPTPTLRCVSSATLVVSCSGGIGLGGPPQPIRLRLHQDLPPPDRCDTGPCPQVSTRVQVDLRCEELVGIEDMTIVQHELIQQIGQAIQMQAPRHVAWTEVSGVGLTINSVYPISAWLCGEEVEVSCQENSALPLLGCPIFNLSDGIVGNQTFDLTGYLGGLGLRWIEGPCPDGTYPTRTPSPTPTVTPTFSPTATPTPTCPLPDFLEDQTSESGDLLLFLKEEGPGGEPADLNCDGEFDHRDVFLFVRFWRPE